MTASDAQKAFNDWVETYFANIDKTKELSKEDIAVIVRDAFIAGGDFAVDALVNEILTHEKAKAELKSN